MKLKIVFANISQGLIYEGSPGDNSVFSKCWPSKYVDFFEDLSLDILCLAEAPFETSNGDGKFVQQCSKDLSLPYYRTDTREQSWIVEGLYYGTAIFSKFEIEKYEVVELLNPGIETIRPNGDVWKLHDKSVQKATLNINGQRVDLFNLHYFPFTYFGRKFDDPEFASAHKFLEDIVTSGSNPAIVTGDFNNDGVEIEDIFQRLFSNNGYHRAVISSSSDLAGYLEKNQIDHILVSENFKVSEHQVIRNYSDHPALVVDVEI